ncbi:hypothetical protein ABZ470_37385 [Streptosporangium sp. NPDC020072]
MNGMPKDPFPSPPTGSPAMEGLSAGSLATNGFLTGSLRMSGLPAGWSS